LPVAADDVRITLPPAQNVVGPPALIVGCGGKGLTVTVVDVEGAEAQLFTVVITV
jgi:hypothetical protein